MRASPAAARAPQPLPLPLPPPPLSLPSPPAAPRRRGLHRASTSSSSSSGSAASSSSSSFCPSPLSPAASPPASTASLVPFAWERHPGVPKTSFRGGSPDTGAPLPLPPPLLRPAARRRRRRHANVAVSSASSGPGTNNSSDPFVAAFAECTRESDDDGDNKGGTDADVSVADRMLLARTKPARTKPGWWLAGGGVLVGLLDLYGCKSAAMAVTDGAFLARRPAVVAHGRAARR